MSESGTALKAVRVRIPDVSWRSYRDQYGLQPDRYAVIVDLSRPISPFEAIALGRINAMVQPMASNVDAVIIADTTLAVVGRSVFRINRELSDAVILGERLRAEALAEDQQMIMAVSRINAELSAEGSGKNPTPAELPAASPKPELPQRSSPIALPGPSHPGAADLDDDSQSVVGRTPDGHHTSTPTAQN